MRAALYAVFALSGLTGLVYEATWTRYLQLFLGHAAYAQVLVLSLFMGGMGAGALLVGRFGQLLRTPLVAYAAVEALLGVAAIGFHPLFALTTGLAYESLLPAAWDSTSALALQWLLAAALIVPQSLLLGMTFPLMSAGVLRLAGGTGGRVFAMLYFANSAGAVIGVLLAGFWMVENLGLPLTMVAAGGGNLLAAATVFGLARRCPTAVPAVTRSVARTGPGRALLALSFLTAVASFLYEIAWLRMLALVQGSSTHAFETMLSAFILGIALGGLWIRGRIERLASPLATLARVQVLMGFAALATLPAYHLSFDVMHWAMTSLPRTELGYAGYNAVGYLISAGIMVPASFFAGMTLPLITFVLYSRGRGESEIGAVYGWNTLGSIAGVALGSLVLMPAVGLKNLLVIGAAIDIALGLVLAAMLVRHRQMTAPAWTAALATAATAAVLVAVFAFELDLTRMASTVYRHGRARLNASSKVVFHADGRTASVDLVAFRDGMVSIETNGKPDAAINMARVHGNRDLPIGSDELTMTLAGALPLAYRPGARRAAIVGHGSGLTTHVVLASPSIERADVIEIEPQMIVAARGFVPRVSRAYNDQRARYVIDDARAFFARAPGRYDIVISEPSNPWVSGVASLFTPQFYRLAKHSLAPGGLFVQWLQLYEFDRSQTASIVRGIGEVFTDYVLYAANDSDLVLVATASGPMPPLSDELFAWKAMRAELDQLDIRAPAQLRALRVASRRAYAPLLERGAANTDYHPTLEFGAARSRFMDRSDATIIQVMRDPVPVLEMLSRFEPVPRTDYAVQAGRHSDRFRDLQRANSIADALLAAGPQGAADALSQMDRANVERVGAMLAGGDRGAWDEWFEALFAIARRLFPNGNTQAVDAFLAKPKVATMLRDAPAEIREKVDFLRLVGARDLDRIRNDGLRLLAGPLDIEGPGFGLYVLVATATACVASAPDPACALAHAKLDQVKQNAPVIDLLRAHFAAPGSITGTPLPFY